MEKITNFCKQYGFVFQGSEIYGGIANTWDYGPLGVELKNNIKKAWHKKFVQENHYNVFLDTAILMNKKVWEASGHIQNFNDPLIDCKQCKTRYRADKLIAEATNGKVVADGWANEKMLEYIEEQQIKCPKCQALDYTDIRKFNMMFKTRQGVIEETANEIYLRPETAQGIFVNFLNVQRSMRLKIPFGIGQIGKSFRNEITPGNFIFRTREFEQMELQFFCKPGEDEKWFAYWKDFCHNWLLSLGLNQEKVRLRNHTKEELSHYSKGTTDLEYKFSFGWGELWGLASRTDYDLTQHQQYANKSMEYLDSETNEKYIPYVIEPSVGVDRLFLAFLVDAYTEETIENGNTREVLKLHPFLAPVKVIVLPLMKKEHSEISLEIYNTLTKHFVTNYDDRGNIGRRYRRADIIGVPYAITIDDETIINKTVTIRNRDTMEQIRIPIEQIVEYVSKKVFF